MAEFLYSYQEDAVKKMHNGCVLVGGVGSGKSRTGLAYYFLLNKGKISKNGIEKMMENPLDLYIITTARKRDNLEWEKELNVYDMSTHKEGNAYRNKVVIDSWQNLHKYVDILHSFFLFDEQHCGGHGQWAKSFIKTAKNNQWVLLSATPADTWMDLVSIFIANGFYKNRTDFFESHVEWDPYIPYRKVKKYWDTGKLMMHYREIMVVMKFKRDTIAHHIRVICDYDLKRYRETVRLRWDSFKNEPIKDAGVLCYSLRRIVNTDKSRVDKVLEYVALHKRVIIFYNFDYELEILRKVNYPEDTTVAEMNGHKHDKLPDSERWVFLVQYSSGSEAWNCITTNAIIFFSQSYSYKTMIQAAGRIDRVNTPYTDLYFYHLESMSSIDLAIKKALSRKKDFNERSFSA